MRGIEFHIQSEYGDILNHFIGEYSEKYDFSISFLGIFMDTVDYINSYEEGTK